MTKLAKQKRVLLVCFYDKICLSIKALSSQLKKAGHQVYVIYLKDDRSATIDTFSSKAVQYQILWLDQFWRTGMDINLITTKEQKIFTSLVKRINPDVIGIGSRSVHKSLAKRTARLLRKVLPKAVFIAGGYGPTIEPKEYLNAFDYVCLGEGDDSIVPFVESDDPRKVPNIAYLKNRTMYWTKPLPPADLDKLPYPDWSSDNKYLIEDNQIRTGTSFYDSQTYDIFCSRGCPSSCSYCMACQWTNMLKPFGTTFPKIRLRSPQSVIDELVWAKNEFNTKYVRFKDDIFGLNEKWLFELMALYDKKIGLPFMCLLDERYINEKIVKRLYKSGLRKTTVGIQSADEVVRKEVLNRQISDDGVVAYAKMLKDIGMYIKYDLIGWNPFETRQSLRRGMDFLKRLPKHGDTCVFQLKVFLGSVLAQRILKEKPKALSTKEYTYWALLHQMVLFSDTMEKQAFELAESLNYNPELPLGIFRKEIQKRSQNFKIVATNDLEKGSRLMTDKIGSVESDKSGISGFEFEKVVGMITKLSIKKGSILQWSDLRHSYAGIRARNSVNIK